MNLDRLWLRVAGLLTLLAALAWYDPGAQAPLQRLWTPLLMAACTWALVQNLAAVAIGATILALIHAEPGSGDWIAGIAYPLVAGAGALTLAVIGWQRFRARVAATHAERWSARRQQ